MIDETCKQRLVPQSIYSNRPSPKKGQLRLEFKPMLIAFSGAVWYYNFRQVENVVIEICFESK
ncbi:hypothetical protein KKC1_22260 [Calderihabitans maritimus]|uniref:Uncharacterized protein n=1 Tax=Calderihabitans maritimus TaxID=1246530 RepID=A0A1Z5HUS8_9FIRM|nr:hypothetical protein KKC1_22260 [Calderihabitans maritimus]